MYGARHIQIIQNNKFAISLQYLKKEMNDEVEFLYSYKHENLPQTGTLILMEMVKDSQSSQNSKLECHYNISKNKLEKKLMFCI